MGGWGETARVRFQRFLNPKGLRHRVPPHTGRSGLSFEVLHRKNKNFFVPFEQIVICDYHRGRSHSRKM